MQFSDWLGIEKFPVNQLKCLLNMNGNRQSEAQTHSSRFSTVSNSCFFSSFVSPSTTFVSSIGFEGWIMMIHTNTVTLTLKPIRMPWNRLSNSRNEKEILHYFYINGCRFFFHIPGTVPTRWCFSLLANKPENFVFLLKLDIFDDFFGINSSVNCIIRENRKRWRGSVEKKTCSRANERFFCNDEMYARKSRTGESLDILSTYGKKNYRVNFAGFTSNLIKPKLHHLKEFLEISC